MVRASILAFLGIFLVACVTTIDQYDGGSAELASVDSKNYILGEVYRANVGDIVIRREMYTGYNSEESFVSSNDFTISGGLMSTSFVFRGKEGEIFPIVAQNGDGNPVFAIPGTRFMMGVNAQGYWDNTVASYNSMTSPIGSGSQYVLTPESTKFEVNTVFRWKKGTPYINHELLLTGFSSSGIHLLFREYTPENLIRASFTQEAVYPLESDRMLFRNYSIEILERDSNYIRYKIVSD
ncbi:hypothetical protein [Minwuia sp. IMCC3077]|uniref:hypothetical protein n=1 Tax=Minwuia sp. IMCC3077 TaxID=3040676 RepID=UPI00247B0BDA|nr:hypothetical protein [Minwuia sp. IMCC3077]